MDEEWEGFKLFTQSGLKELRERQKRLQSKKATEKFSGAKQCIFKGNELLILTVHSFLFKVL